MRTKAGEGALSEATVLFPSLVKMSLDNVRLISYTMVRRDCHGICVEELIERLMEYYSRIRKESGVSQSELERITGMSRSAINRYEKGKLMPTVRAMNKLLVPVGYRLAIVPLEEDKEEQDEENIDL